MRSAIALLVLFILACGGEPRENAPSAASGAAGPSEIASPAGAGAAEPHLISTRDGGLLMSWLEPAGEKRHALRFATYRGGEWSKAATIATRDDFFVNWADFPSITEDAEGNLFAHWLQKSGPGTYAYDVWVTVSRDAGRTWSAPRIVHDDGKQAEHGFVSMAPLAERGVAAVWLDGREMGEADHGHPTGSMTLRYAEIDPALQLSNESMLDPRVCECCTTSMTMTPSGPVIAYRDRSEEEIRDISVVRAADGAWSDPARVHPDEWKIAGCPVNGPQIDSRGDRVAVAWFTAADGQPLVQTAFSSDGGVTFAAPVRIDGGDAVGRVDLLMLDDGSALVTWIEGAGEKAGIVARRVAADGTLGEPVRVASTTSARTAGFPRAARAGDETYVAWTDTAAKTIRIARL